MPDRPSECPHCHAPKGTAERETCAECGAKFDRTTEEDQANAVEGRFPREGVLGPGSWWGMLGIFLLPVVICALFARAGDSVFFVGLIAAGAASLYCGFWISGRVIKGSVSRFFGGVALALLLFILELPLCVAGCSAAGFRMGH